MFYFGSLFLGLALVAFALTYFITKRDFVYDFRERYDLYIGASDITVNTPAGLKIGLAVSKNDREVAWRIYIQLSTRVALVDFNESYDSFYLVNESLHSLFAFIRDQLAQIPVERIRRDKNNEMISFYTSILNEGIRPYLSKWHGPVSSWIETQKKKTPDASYYEMEKTFPQRKEILSDMQAMNLKIKIVGDQLLKIAKANP